MRLIICCVKWGIMHKLQRGRPRIPLRIRARVIELGNKDLSAKEINEKLRKEGIDRIPSERTIQYILADYWRLTHEEKAKDKPLDFFHLGLAGLTSESLPVLLEALGSFVTRDLGEREGRSHATWGALNEPLTGRLASWLSWVHHAAPDLDISDKVDLAEYLAAADLVEVVYGERWDNRWLIGFFAMKPWVGEEARVAYREAVRRGLIPEPPDETELRASRLLGRFLSLERESQS